MEELRPLDDVGSATWVGRALAPIHGRVSGLVPSGFDGYARILHRAMGADGWPVRWARVASAQHRQVHALAQFAQVAGRFDYDDRSKVGWDGENPEKGSLDDEQLHALLEVLAQCSGADAECLLLLWEGRGNLPSRWRQRPHRVRQDGRTYFLFRARLDEVEAVSARWALPLPVLEESTDRSLAAALEWDAPIVQSPNQWWPTDRSWFVASEVDYDSTFVGGPSHLIRRIVDHPCLEAFPVDLDDCVSCEGDRRNPPIPTG